MKLMRVTELANKTGFGQPRCVRSSLDLLQHVREMDTELTLHAR